MVSLVSLTPLQLREVSYYHQMVVEVFAICLGFAHMGEGEATTVPMMFGQSRVIFV